MTTSNSVTSSDRGFTLHWMRFAGDPSFMHDVGYINSSPRWMRFAPNRRAHHTQRAHHTRRAPSSLHAAQITVLLISIVGSSCSHTGRTARNPDPLEHQHSMGQDLPAPAPLSESEEVAVDREASLAVTSADWSTVRAVRVEGFEPTTVDREHPDDHLIAEDRVDEVFDPAKPEMLLAASDDPDSPIVALVYWVEGERPPEGFAGGSDVWHHHPGACRFKGVVNGDGGGGDPQQCRAGGGEVVSEGGWMIHAWLLPGFENPDGRFAVNNPSLSEELRS